MVYKQWRNGKAIPQESERPLMFAPDFVLVRSDATTVDNQKGRKHLLALLYANVPSINSLQSILLCCDKPTIQAGLHRVRSKHYRGRESEFPLIPQELYTGTSTFFYGGSFPAVLKFGSANAGYGKVKVPHYKDMDDFRTLLPMTIEGYVTAEPFVMNSGGDYRIQKIGKHIRAFKRFDFSGSWKTNAGTGAIMFEVPVTKTFQEWIENASKLFGEDDPLDICTIDAIVELPPGAQVVFPEGALQQQTSSAKPSLLPITGFPNPDTEKIHILELNDTSSGLHRDYGAVDNNCIAELVIEKLNSIYCV
jgi:glutathione synthase/RimK-type ligase-like ATP-grasp enzyme